jgi:hypothetical protein
VAAPGAERSVAYWDLECPLLGVERKSDFEGGRSVDDPTRTSALIPSRLVCGCCAIGTRHRNRDDSRALLVRAGYDCASFLLGLVGGPLQVTSAAEVSPRDHEEKESNERDWVRVSTLEPPPHPSQIGRLL